MRIILLQDVKKVGQRGTIATVADGYAQNVLLPQKLAVPATGANLKKHEEGKRKKEDREAYEETLLLKNLEKIDGQTITIEAKANDSGTLFQAIRAKQVTEAIEKQFGVVIPEALIVVDDIKKKGNYELKILQKGTGVTALVAVE